MKHRTKSKQKNRIDTVFRVNLIYSEGNSQSNLSLFLLYIPISRTRLVLYRHVLARQIVRVRAFGARIPQFKLLELAPEGVNGWRNQNSNFGTYRIQTHHRRWFLSHLEQKLEWCQSLSLSAHCIPKISLPRQRHSHLRL